MIDMLDKPSTASTSRSAPASPARQASASPARPVVYPGLPFRPPASPSRTATVLSSPSRIVHHGKVLDVSD